MTGQSSQSENDLDLDYSGIAKQWQHDHKNQEPQKQIIAIKSLLSQISYQDKKLSQYRNVPNPIKGEKKQLKMLKLRNILKLIQNL